jgi:hypothetical protein
MNGMPIPDVSKNEMLVGVGIPFFETTPKQKLEEKKYTGNMPSNYIKKK